MTAPTSNQPATQLNRQVTQMIDRLREHQPDLAVRHHVKSLGLFGSYVRGEQTSESDLDVLVEFLEPPSLFEFIRLEQALTTLLGIKVDLVMKDALKPAIGKHILQEVVAV